MYLYTLTSKVLNHEMKKEANRYVKILEFDKKWLNLRRKRATIIVILVVVVVAVISFAATYAYANYFGLKTVLQTNSDKFNCRQGNVLDGVDRQARFNVLSTCENVTGIVHDMKGTRRWWWLPV